MQFQLSDENRDKSHFIFYIVVFLVGALAIVGGRYLYQNKEKYDLVAVVVEKPIVEVTPTPSAVADDPNKIYKLKVVNSTGEKGLAAKTVELLKGKGIILETSTGNGEERSGTKLFFKSEGLKTQKIGQMITTEWPNATVEIRSQAEDVVIDLGKK